VIASQGPRARASSLSRFWATDYSLASQGPGRGRKLVGPLTDEINRSGEAL